MKKTYLLAVASAGLIGSLLVFSAPAQAQEEEPLDITPTQGSENMMAEGELDQSMDAGGQGTLETTAMETPVNTDAGYLGSMNPGYNRGRCVIQGTQTCPKIQTVSRTACRQVPVPTTVYRSRPFQGRTNCPNCIVQGTRTCPETQITYRTVCRQVMTPTLTYETKPFHATACPPSPCR